MRINLVTWPFVLAIVRSFMATAPRFVESLSAVCGIHPATMQRYVSDLTAAGLVRKSGKGGGKASVHFNDLETAYVLLAMASATPGGAADAILALQKLFPRPAPGAASLITALTGTIGSLGNAIARGVAPESLIEEGWTLTVRLSPLLAWSVLPPKDGKDCVVFYREDWSEPMVATDHAALQRHTVIGKAALIAAAKVFASGGERSALLAQPGVRTPETNTAASSPLPGSDAAVTNDQLAETELDGSSQVHSTEERKKAQPSPEDAAGDSLEHDWSASHDDPGPCRTFRAAA